MLVPVHWLMFQKEKVPAEAFRCHPASIKRIEELFIGQVGYPIDGLCRHGGFRGTRPLLLKDQSQL
jgi:hypothetical protein